ncbi:MAG: hypothetical protein PWP48_1204 [Clostridiales bacterium]|jgi:GMP synthase (glutamine-hydrolysing)|nr:hypothetical protein [Clostridiales bacterium]MDK2991971.1 hypothetical protein [Clostridiales bacterium]
MPDEVVLVLDFGGQYNELIARRVREAKVYCEVLPYNTSLERIKSIEPKGIIFTGGPSSVYADNAPYCDDGIYRLGIPILGICYGAQLMAKQLGGNVARAQVREYGRTDIHVDNQSVLFHGIESDTVGWMSHTDYIDELPAGFKVIASSSNCPVAAMADEERKLYAVQFHPEVVHTPRGFDMLKNFLYKVCGCNGTWTMTSFIEDTVASIKERVGDGSALCAMSGGVDSSVAAMLVHKAIGRRLTCILVDHGLMRQDEVEEVERVFKEQFNVNLVVVDASDRFLSKLKGVTDPERKRKIIGEEFIRVFEEQAKALGHIDYLVQGTIYPDVIESGRGDAAVIKSHHNVGGLPEDIDFKGIIEPLRNLFKDEVRKVGLELGMPEKVVWRQPFPGPGLAIRIIGEVTPEKLAILRHADAILREEIAKAGLNREIWQYFAVLTGMRSVGVMGDERTYDYTIALRAVTSTDGMTADWARIPYDVLSNISNRIVNEVQNVNRVVYDITSKPPATIEWE